MRHFRTSALIAGLGAALAGAVSADHHHETPPGKGAAPAGTDSRADSLAPGASLPALVAWALAHNPALRAAEWEAKARHSGPGHVWALPAPEVGVEFYQAPVGGFPNPMEGQQEIDYRVGQAFPFPGVIGARIRVEHEHAGAAEAEWEALRVQTARDVKAGYYRAWLVARRSALNARHRAWTERLIAIARRQYEEGIGSQADILRAQSEATRLLMDGADLERESAAALAGLNALLGRDPDAPLRPADSLAAPADTADYARLLAAAEAHPDVRAKSAEIRMKQAEGDLARRGYWPGFKIMAAYKDMLAMPPGVHGAELRDYWSVGLSMDLPVAFWSLPAARAASARSRAELERAKADHRSARDVSRARALAASARDRALRERLRLAREALLPQTRQAYESALAAYQGGREGFSGVLEAARAVLAAEEGAAADLAALLEGRADLEAAAGSDPAPAAAPEGTGP